MAAGFPYRVSTDPTHAERVHVDLRCRHCKKEWHVEHTTSALRPAALEAEHTQR
jgi:hypothetical protein